MYSLRLLLPATDCIEKFLDLNELLVKRKEPTFFMCVGGVSMVEFGINDRDMEFKEDGAELEIWGVVTHAVHSF